MFWEFLLPLVVVLVVDAILAAVTWFLVSYFWNNIVRKELQVGSNKGWACLLVSVILLSNAATIILLVDAVSRCVS